MSEHRTYAPYAEQEEEQMDAPAGWPVSSSFTQNYFCTLFYFAAAAVAAPPATIITTAAAMPQHEQRQPPPLFT